MTGKQRAVLWIGLILVAFNLVRKWPEIVSVIFANPSGTTPGGGTAPSGGGNSITIPVDPLLPTGPKITIPLPHLSLPNGNIPAISQQVSQNVAGRSPTGTVSGSRLLWLPRKSSPGMTW